MPQYYDYTIPTRVGADLRKARESGKCVKDQVNMFTTKWGTTFYRDFTLYGDVLLSLLDEQDERTDEVEFIHEFVKAMGKFPNWAFHKLSQSKVCHRERLIKIAKAVFETGVKCFRLDYDILMQVVYSAYHHPIDFAVQRLLDLWDNGLESVSCSVSFSSAEEFYMDYGHIFLEHNTTLGKKIAILVTNFPSSHPIRTSFVEYFQEALEMVDATTMKEAHYNNMYEWASKIAKDPNVVLSYDETIR